MGMPPRPGGRHWIRTTGNDDTAAMHIKAQVPRPVVDGAAIAGFAAELAPEFAYAVRSDVTDETAPIPVAIPGPRRPFDGPSVESATVRIDAWHGATAVVEQDRGPELDSPTSTLGAVQAKPVFVDESGRRKRLLALAGATAVTVCAAYVAVVGVSVLHGSDIGPVGSALAGLLPPTVSADAPDPDDGDPAVDTVTGNARPAIAADAPRVAVVPAAEQVSPTSSVQVAAPPTTTRKQSATTRSTTRVRSSRTNGVVPSSVNTSTAQTPTTTSAPETTPETPDGPGAADSGS